MDVILRDKAEELAKEIAVSISTQQELSDVMRLMTKSVIERMLDAEKAVVCGLKKIYQAATFVEAEQALEAFAQAWQATYPTIIKMWRAKWTDIITLFDFPAPIRKAVSTTNAIESVNSVIRKFTRNRKIYPNEESALKITFMAIREASQKWTMPIRGPVKFFVSGVEV